MQCLSIIEWAEYYSLSMIARHMGYDNDVLHISVQIWIRKGLEQEGDTLYRKWVQALNSDDPRGTLQLSVLFRQVGAYTIDSHVDRGVAAATDWQPT